MRVLLDSSALAKRYVSEPGPEQVLRRCHLFISADRRQCEAAARLKLRTENVGNLP